MPRGARSQSSPRTYAIFEACSIKSLITIRKIKNNACRLIQTKRKTYIYEDGPRAKRETLGPPGGRRPPGHECLRIFAKDLTSIEWLALIAFNLNG